MKLWYGVVVLALAMPALGSIIGQPNDARDPGFEMGPAGGQSPEWTKVSGGGNVRVYGGGDFGPTSPAGGQKYGSASSWGTDSGRIEQYFVNPEPDEWTKTVAIGAWLYAHSFDGSGVPNDSSNVRLSLHIAGMDFYTPWIHTGDEWQWHELVVTDLPCNDFVVDIEFQQQWGVAWNLTFADGIDVEHICIPEPAALALVGLAALPWLRRRR